MKDKIRSTMPEESLNYLCILALESDVTMWSFIAEAIEEYPAEKLYGKNIKELCRSVN
jgi:hypothetical protein